ncbi:Alkaline ceramidase 3 [Podochytrium sp. JEL0797]|nr:Alkaline ceramidase 3 [Podochytrium sp. JEL0797]
MGFGLRPAGNDGHWGEVTSTLDWCEENYLITPYLAEFWNSTSNILFVIGTLIGLASIQSARITETRTVLSLLSVAGIGIGSFLFHGSLWYETQMMDELPMIYGCCVMVYANLRVFPETNTPTSNRLLALGLSIYAVAVTVMYLHLNNPVFHEVCYGLLAAILFLLPPIQFYHMKANYPQYSNRISSLWKMYWYGSVSYLGGFLIWGIDNNFCEIVRSVRLELGYPLRVFFELHMWWHFGTALGTYSSIMLVTYLRQLALGRDDIQIKWVGGVFPVLVSTKHSAIHSWALDCDPQEFPAIGGLYACVAVEISIDFLTIKWNRNVTSTLDWCEENYIVSAYVAEFWNSLSNLFYIVLALIGLRSAITLGITDRRVYIGHFAIAAVGVGSYLFHSTLHFETQMMDELPMIYGSCVLVFSQLRVFPETNIHNHRLIAILAVYAIAITAMYLNIQNPVFQEAGFGVLVAIQVLTPPRQFERMMASSKLATHVPELVILYWSGIACYLIGFALWNVDNGFCEHLRSIRGQVGYPLRVVFELHVWWHLGTAMGTYIMALLVTFMRQIALGREDIRVAWVGGVLPVLEKYQSKEKGE